MLKFLSPTLHTILMAPEDEGGNAGGGGSETPEQKAAREADAAKKKADEGNIDPLATDIKAAIEKARKQEKDKLYGQIEEAKKAAKTNEELAIARANEVKTLQQQVAELQAKVKPAGDGEGDEEKKSKRRTLDEDTLNKAIDAAVALTSKKLEEQFKAELTAAQNRIIELERGTQEKDLATYRDQLISANKDAIVPELVAGKTREELDTSLVLAKQAFARVTQGLKKDTKTGEEQPPAPASQKLVLPPTPNVNDNGAPGAPRAVDVKQLSSTDYAKNRQDLLKAAAAEARKSLTEA